MKNPSKTKLTIQRSLQKYSAVGLHKKCNTIPTQNPVQYIQDNNNFKKADLLVRNILGLENAVDSTKNEVML